MPFPPPPPPPTHTHTLIAWVYIWRLSDCKPSGYYQFEGDCYILMCTHANTQCIETHTRTNTHICTHKHHTHTHITYAWIAGRQVIEEEGLCENAAKLGKVLSSELSKLDASIVTTVRGRGLLFACVIKPHKGGSSDG